MYIAEKYRPGVFIFVAIFSLICSIGLSKLSFDFEIEQLFPKNDPDLEFYQMRIEAYQDNKSYLLIALNSQNGVFNPAFLQELEGIRDSLERLDFVQSSVALSNLNYYKFNPVLLSPIERKFFSKKRRDKIAQDSIFFRSYEDAWEKFMSEDGKATAIYLSLSPFQSQDEARNQLLAIRQILDNQSSASYHVSGSLDAKDGVVSQLKRELLLLFSLSFAFIIAVLVFTFRSWGGIFIPLLVILLSVVWTVGSMAWFGVDINTMTVLVPSIVLIVALSDVIHIMSRFKEEIRPGISAREAMKIATKDIGRAILLTSITTAIGFLSLSYADIQPFVDFAMFTALGVLYAYLLAIFLLPQLLIFSPNLHSPSQGRFKAWAQGLYDYCTKGAGLILGLSCMLILFSIYGISKLKIDSQMYEEISSGDRYSQSLNFLDNNFRGIRPVEIYLASKDPQNSLMDYRNMQKLDSLETYLKDVFQVNSVYSILVQVKRLNRVYYQGKPEHFELPKEGYVFDRINQVLDSNFYEMELQNILAKDRLSTLIQAKIEDLGSYEIGKRNAALLAFGEKLFPSDQYAFKITGKAQILDKSNVIITRNLGFGLLTALLIVALIMGILFRSFGIIALAFIPNLLPLILIAGLMGVLGIGLKMSTAIIFSIAFGIAVDDTIHFLSRLKFEWRNGVSVEEAVKRTYLSTGKAIIITSIILILGFGILLFSGFQATFTSGLFISLALVFAVFADLLLLPVLLLKVYNRKTAPESGEAAYN